MGYGCTCVHDLRNSSFKKIGVNKSFKNLVIGLKIQLNNNKKSSEFHTRTRKVNKTKVITKSATLKASNLLTLVKNFIFCFLCYLRD